MLVINLLLDPPRPGPARGPGRARCSGSTYAIQTVGSTIPEAESAELAAFTGALNTMVDRLAEERRVGARAALSAQEAERLRIARALHDEAGQTLTAVALEIERAADAGRSQMSATALARRGRPSSTRPWMRSVASPASFVPRLSTTWV